MALTTTPAMNISKSFHEVFADDYHSTNSSSSHLEFDLLSCVATFERFFVPCVSIPGFIGNFLSAITFLSKALRKSRSSFLLVARCINDMVFLLCLLFVWASVNFQLGLFHLFGACHTVIFFTFFTAFMAVWLCGCMTFEQYLLITNRLSVKRWWTTKTPALCMGTISAVGVCVYVSSFWMADENCILNPEYGNLIQILGYVDILMTLIFPSVVITCLLVLISLRVTQVKYEKRRRMSRLSLYSSNSMVTTVASPAARVTKMLLVYTILLLTLHCPSHAMTLFSLIKLARKDVPVLTENQAALRSGLQMVFYLGFTLNFVIFYTLSQNFRREFLKIFCGKKNKNKTFRTDARPVNFQRRHTIEGLLHIGDDPEAIEEITTFLRTHRCASR